MVRRVSTSRSVQPFCSASMLQGVNVSKSSVNDLASLSGFSHCSRVVEATSEAVSVVTTGSSGSLMFTFTVAALLSLSSRSRSLATCAPSSTCPLFSIFGTKVSV